MNYRILSPDGLPLYDESLQQVLRTKSKIMDYITGWCDRYKNQGYYLTAEGERIPWLELPTRLKIIRWGIRGNITEMSVEALNKKKKGNSKWKH